MKVNLNSLSGSYWNKQSLIPICLGLLIGGTGLGTGKAQSNPQSARRPVDASEFKISAISLGMTHEQLLKAHPESVQEDCEEYRDLTDPRNEYLQHYGTIGWGTCTFGLNLTSPYKLRIYERPTASGRVVYRIILSESAGDQRSTFYRDVVAKYGQPTADNGSTKVWCMTPSNAGSAYCGPHTQLRFENVLGETTLELISFPSQAELQEGYDASRKAPL